MIAFVGLEPKIVAQVGGSRDAHRAGAALDQMTLRRGGVGRRRARTRHLIELGGLVMKAELVELTDDDRAVILGLLVEAATKLRGDDREQMLTLWRRRGLRTFVGEEGQKAYLQNQNSSSLGAGKS